MGTEAKEDESLFLHPSLPPFLLFPQLEHGEGPASLSGWLWVAGPQGWGSRGSERDAFPRFQAGQDPLQGSETCSAPSFSGCEGPPCLVMGCSHPGGGELGEEGALAVPPVAASHLLRVAAPAPRSPCFWIFPLHGAIAKAE